MGKFMRMSLRAMVLVVAVMAAGCNNPVPSSLGGLQTAGVAAPAAGQQAAAPAAASGTGAEISSAANGGSGVAAMSGTGAAAAATSGSGASAASGAGAGAGVGGMSGASAGSSGTAGATAGRPAPSAMACTGKPGKLRGKSSQMLTIGGTARSFVYYAPQSLDANKAVPLVIVPHGFLLSGEAMVEITRYTDLADKEGFAVAFPDGQDTTWNFGGSDCGSSILGVLPESAADDQAFMDGIIKFTEADQCVDHAHMFMTGFSMGGYFTNQNGCLRDDLAAVAPHSGGSHDLSTCAVKHKPIMIMHFNPDGLIPYMCGQQARDRWVKQNGCEMASPEVRMVKGGKCEYYKGCMPKGQVAFCTFDVPKEAMSDTFPGHAWSGGSKDGTHNGAEFAIPQTESATTLGWNFFKEFAW
jgi:poly(3-hydroxybutyrate) depolymerase